MAKAKSARPSRNAKISRARQSVRTSSRGCSPPCSAGTTALRKPASASALTRARQAASTSSCGSLGSAASAQRTSASAKRRWPSSKKGQLRASSRLISIALEHRLLFGGESTIGAREVLRLHAQCLGHRLGLDRGLHRHRPFHLQHALGHGIGEGRPGRKLGRELLRLAEYRAALGEPIEEAPAFGLLAGKHATSIEQLGGAALPDDARQDRAGTHVAT